MNETDEAKALTGNAAETADAANAEFWDMLCGSGLAKALGATDATPRSLAIFDTYFLSYYAYLFDWIPFTELADKDVLEVGLGYGTVGQALAAARCRYTGLDVARGPVGLMNQRLALVGLPGRAVTGSILAAPFEDASFDFVVAIGCLHHTGDINRAMSEISRLLRPGGSLMMMVYYAYSFRIWHKRGYRLIGEIMSDICGRSLYSAGGEDERVLFDSNETGAAAPHTVFVSKRQLRRLARRNGLSVVRARTENASQEPPFSHLSRDRLLKTWARIIGLDLYATLKKI